MEDKVFRVIPPADIILQKYTLTLCLKKFYYKFPDEEIKSDYSKLSKLDKNLIKRYYVKDFTLYELDTLKISCFLKENVFPLFRPKYINDLSPEQVQDVIKSIEDRKKYLSKIYDDIVSLKLLEKIGEKFTQKHKHFSIDHKNFKTKDNSECSVIKYYKILKSEKDYNDNINFMEQYGLTESDIYLDKNDKNKGDTEKINLINNRKKKITSVIKNPNKIKEDNFYNYKYFLKLITGYVMCVFMHSLKTRINSLSTYIECVNEYPYYATRYQNEKDDIEKLFVESGENSGYSKIYTITLNKSEGFFFDMYLRSKSKYYVADCIRLAKNKEGKKWSIAYVCNNQGDAIKYEDIENMRNIELYMNELDKESEIMYQNTLLKIFNQ